MISSMTGYATLTTRIGGALVSIDLRSVNQRYLEIAFRMPDELRAHEPILREAIARRLGRGKVECRLSLTALAEATTDIGLNPGLLESLQRWQQTALASFPEATPLTVADILRWNGMLATGGARLDAEDGATIDRKSTRLNSSH